MPQAASSDHDHECVAWTCLTNKSAPMSSRFATTWITLYMSHCQLQAGKTLNICLLQ